MIAPVRKAVFPVAGLGTRFLPATKVMPKEMLTIVDRPLIQCVVEEARAAGIEHLILVTGRNKGLIEDHFDIQPELDEALRARGRATIADGLVRALPPAGQMSFTRQHRPLGLGHAIWCARELVGDEPFAVLLPDMIARGMPGCLTQLLEVYRQTGGNVVSVEECAPEDAARYGIVGVGAPAGGGFGVTAMVEKPAKGTEPSNLYMNGRYILQPEIFAVLGNAAPGAGGEIQLTDAMNRLAEKQPFHGHRFDGRTYDCGSIVGFLAANIAFALDRPEVAAELAGELRRILGTETPG